MVKIVTFVATTIRACAMMLAVWFGQGRSAGRTGVCSSHGRAPKTSREAMANACSVASLVSLLPPPRMLPLLISASRTCPNTMSCPTTPFRSIYEPRSSRARATANFSEKSDVVTPGCRNAWPFQERQHARSVSFLEGGAAQAADGRWEREKRGGPAGRRPVSS
eukprot:SAG11_NODE_96_length_17016_cov_18.755113_3_plen_164_part_00